MLVMSIKGKDKWSNVRVRKSIIDQINQFLKSKEAEKLGILNTADFVNLAIRKSIEEINLGRFEHFNLQDNIIRVLDKEIGTRGDIIEVFHKNNSLRCSHCEKTDCVHVKFLWTDQNLVKEFNKMGIKKPF